MNENFKSFSKPCGYTNTYIFMNEIFSNSYGYLNSCLWSQMKMKMHPTFTDLFRLPVVSYTRRKTHMAFNLIVLRIYFYKNPFKTVRQYYNHQRLRYQNTNKQISVFPWLLDHTLDFSGPFTYLYKPNLIEDRST